MQVLTTNEVEQISGGGILLDIVIGVASAAVWDAVKGTYTYVTGLEYGAPTYSIDMMGNY